MSSIHHPCRTRQLCFSLQDEELEPYSKFPLSLICHLLLCSHHINWECFHHQWPSIKRKERLYDWNSEVYNGQGVCCHVLKFKYMKARTFETSEEYHNVFTIHQQFNLQKSASCKIDDRNNNNTSYLIRLAT